MCISLGYNVFVFFLLIKIFKFFFGWLMFKSAKEGAQTTIHLAVSEEVKGITGNLYLITIICMSQFKC